MKIYLERIVKQERLFCHLVNTLILICMSAHGHEECLPFPPGNINFNFLIFQLRTDFAHEILDLQKSTDTKLVSLFRMHSFEVHNQPLSWGFFCFFGALYADLTGVLHLSIQTFVYSFEELGGKLW